jgi:hypothetical protein
MQQIKPGKGPSSVLRIVDIHERVVSILETSSKEENGRTISN